MSMSNGTNGRPEDDSYFRYKRFPTESLPPEVSKYIVAVSKSMNVHPGMCGLLALPVLGAAIGNSVRIKMKSTWSEPTVIWAALVQESGTLKTPVLRQMVQPVIALETAEIDRYKKAVNQYEDDLSDYEDSPAGLKKDMSKPEEPEERTRYRMDDTTVEAIARVHSDNPRGLLLHRNELAGWLGDMDRYHDASSDLQKYIEIYDGNLLQIDRKTGKKKTTDIRYPHVCLVGTIQPGVLESRTSKQHLETGFTQRIMVTVPPTKMREWSEARVDRGTYLTYRRLVHILYEIPFVDEPEVIPMSGKARGRYMNYYDENGVMLRQVTDPVFRSVMSKTEAITARIALIFQMCKDRSADEVDFQCMHRAVRIGKWIRYEMARVYSYLGFLEGTSDPDEYKAGQLPEQFGWEDIAKVWEVGRRHSFRIANRLIEKGMAADLGKRKGYERLIDPVDRDYLTIVDGMTPDMSDNPEPKYTIDTGHSTGDPPF